MEFRAKAREKNFALLTSIALAGLIAVSGSVASARQTCETRFDGLQSRAVVPAPQTRAVTTRSFSPDSQQVAHTDVLIATLSFNDPQFLASYFRKNYTAGDDIRKIIKHKKGLINSELLVKRLGQIASESDRNQDNWSPERMAELATELMARLRSDLLIEKGFTPLTKIDADLKAKKITESIVEEDSDFVFTGEQFQDMRQQFVNLAKLDQGEKFIQALIYHQIDKLQELYELRLLQVRKNTIIEEARRARIAEINSRDYDPDREFGKSFLSYATALIGMGSFTIWGPFTPQAFFSIETLLILPEFVFLKSLFPYSFEGIRIRRLITNTTTELRLAYHNRISAPLMRRMARKLGRKQLESSIEEAITNGNQTTVDTDDLALPPVPEENRIEFTPVTAGEIDEIQTTLSGNEANNPTEISLLGESIPEVLNRLRLESSEIALSGAQTTQTLFSYVNSFTDTESIRSLEFSTLIKIGASLSNRREHVVAHLRELSGVFARLGDLRTKTLHLADFLETQKSSDNQNISEAAEVALGFVARYLEDIDKAEESIKEIQGNFNLQRELAENYQRSFSPVDPEVSTDTAEILLQLREAIMLSIR